MKFTQVMRAEPSYEHTQQGRVHWILAAVAFLLGLMAIFLPAAGRPILFLASAGMALLAFCFVRLTVRDEGEWLRLEYGPLKLFGKRIRYAEMRSVQPGRSALIDGFGIHFVPGRGWTYNLDGFDCAVLRLAGNRTLRVGTDDREGLVEFLARRLKRG